MKDLLKETLVLDEVVLTANEITNAISEILEKRKVTGIMATTLSVAQAARQVLVAFSMLNQINPHPVILMARETMKCDIEDEMEMMGDILKDLSEEND